MRWAVLLLAGWVVGVELYNTALPGLPKALFGPVADQVVLTLASLLCLARTWAAPRPERPAWALLGGGLLVWSAGDWYWALVLYDLEEIPIPSPADAGYLALIPLAFAGLVRLARARLCAVPRGLWLDGLVAALAAGAVSAAVVLDPVAAGASGSLAEVVTGLAYPVGDLALLTLIVGTVALQGWRLDATWALLGAGVLVFWASDSLYLVTNASGSYDTGSWFDAGWTLTAVLCAGAGWHGRAAAQQPTPAADGARVVVMPVLCALVSLGLLVGGAAAGLNPLANGLAAASLVAVLARLADANRLNTALLTASRREASTDALTGLGNRRQLAADLDHAVARQGGALLALYDLDGFKHYNDSFGHAAGDALLARLGRALAHTLGGAGQAYRMGGDEFCALVGDGQADLLAAGARALSESGEGFTVGCSYGMVEVPREAADPHEALRLADGRMYAHKHGERGSGARHTKDALLRVLAERSPDLQDHTEQVADLAEAVARRLGLGRDEIEAVRHAAELHDIGKLAIPDAILHKPAPLDAEEWAFMRRHTLIGEKILAAAPGFAAVGALVRASHERWDGRGYPDALAGEAIPLGARIVAVCDAFDAMVTDRPYHAAMTPDASLDELEACAGRQFDPAVVNAFWAVWHARDRSLVAQAA